MCVYNERVGIIPVISIEVLEVGGVADSLVKHVNGLFLDYC
jgi:hypothetical protein